MHKLPRLFISTTNTLYINFVDVGTESMQENRMSLLDPILQQFQKLLYEAKQAIVFTGAGVSTESGIPDFRSPGGIWTKHQPVTFQDFLKSETIRHESWKRKFATDTVVENAKPNPESLANIYIGAHFLLHAQGFHPLGRRSPPCLTSGTFGNRFHQQRQSV